jgi:hypothetical protein
MDRRGIFRETTCSLRERHLCMRLDRSAKKKHRGVSPMLFLCTKYDLCCVCLRHAGEGLRIVDREVSHDLLVDRDTILAHCADELRERSIERSKSCRNLDLPEAAEVILLVAAMSECVDTRLADCHLRLDLLVRATIAVTLSCAEYIAAMLH